MGYYIPHMKSMLCSPDGIMTDLGCTADDSDESSDDEQTVNTPRLHVESDWEQDWSERYDQTWPLRDPGSPASPHILATPQQHANGALPHRDQVIMSSAPGQSTAFGDAF